MKTLRPYQQAAVDAVFDYFAEKRGYAPLIVAPVGAGKSLIHAEIIRRIHEHTPRTRIVSLTHVKELLTQNAEELRLQYPNADFGFYCSGLGQKRLHNDITFASVQSIHNKAHLFNRAPQVILIDECHLLSHNEDTTYRKFINKCLELNPNLVVIGLTGSPFRADTGRLDEGDGRLFTGIAYEIEINWMIEQGYLCKPVTPQVSTKMDISGVQTRGGDYVAGQLEKAVDVDATTQACVREILHHGQNRNKVLIFTAGVQHCQHVRDAIRALGHQAEMVTGETEPSERADTLRRYKHGEFKYLVNVAVLTTGYNEPSIDMLAFMRPTKSPVLYLQTTGRGIRTVYAPGYDLETQQGRLDAIAASPKKECLILDFGDVVKTLGPIDTLDIRKQPKKQVEREPGKAITKRCPSCGTVCAASQRYCYNCSYSFIDASLSNKASKAAVVSADQAPEEYAVIDMELSQHHKKNAPDAPPTLKVTYTTLAGPFSEYVCFEHHTYPPGDPKRFAWDKAVAWHKARKPNDKPPTSVEDALFMLYPNPSHVTVKREGKYWRVLSCRFDHDKVTAIERPDLQLEREIAERNIMFENEGLSESVPF